MSSFIFVDTSAWKAWIDRSDDYHSTVAQQFEHCRKNHLQLLTSDYVISETLTLLRMRRGLGHSIALQFGNIIFQSKLVQVIHIGSKLFQSAWKIFSGFEDKEFSFVDCSSFALMEKNKIKKALSLDHHFTQYGFDLHL